MGARFEWARSGWQGLINYLARTALANGERLLRLQLSAFPSRSYLSPLPLRNHFCFAFSELSNSNLGTVPLYACSNAKALA
jgi:hypothetical protein